MSCIRGCLVAHWDGNSSEKEKKRLLQLGGRTNRDRSHGGLNLRIEGADTITKRRRQSPTITPTSLGFKKRKSLEDHEAKHQREA